MTKRAFAKGAYIFYPGNPCLYTYFIESGLLRLFFVNTSGQEFLLNLIHPYNLFGFPLLGNDQFRLTGAAAYQPSVVLSISRDNLIQFMSESSKLMQNLYQELIINSRKLILHIRSLVTLSLLGRLAAMLLRLANLHEKQTQMIDMPLSQEELASWLGASRGRLNQALNQLQHQCLIQVDGQKILILDLKGLENLTENQIMDQV